MKIHATSTINCICETLVEKKTIVMKTCSIIKDYPMKNFLSLYHLFRTSKKKYILGDQHQDPIHIIELCLNTDLNPKFDVETMVFLQLQLEIKKRKDIND